MAEIVEFPKEPKRLQCAVEFANLMVARLIEVLSYKGYNPEVSAVRDRVTKIVHVMYFDQPEVFDGRTTDELEHSALEFAYDLWGNFTS